MKHRLKQIFESVESLPDEESEGPAFRVHERLTVEYESEKHISLHWRSDPISDKVSDSLVALVLNISREIPKVVVESEEATKTEEENSKKAEKVVHALLVSLLGDGDKCRWNEAHLDKQIGNVESENEGLKERVRVAFQRIQNAVKPIPSICVLAPSLRFSLYF